MTHAGAVEEPIQVSHSDQQMLFTSVSPWGDSGQQMTGAEAVREARTGCVPCMPRQPLSWIVSSGHRSVCGLGEALSPGTSSCLEQMPPSAGPGRSC